MSESSICFCGVASAYVAPRPYADWLDYILSQKDSEIPKSISTSYGDDEQTGALILITAPAHPYATSVKLFLNPLSSSQLRYSHMQPIRPARRSWRFGHLLLWRLGCGGR